MTKWRTWVPVVVALAAMGLVVRNGLVYDAAQLLLHDGRYAVPIDWGALLTHTYWPSGLWRPITSVLLGVEATLGGGAVFHATSLALYALVCVLIVRLVLALTENPTIAVIVGTLFAAHPVHVEVVASVVGQAEMLTALGLIGGALVWHRATVHGVTGGTIPLLLGAQVLAALSKEQGFVLPALLLGQHLLLPRRLARRDAMRLATPLVLLTVMLLLIRTIVTGSVGGETPLPILASLGVVGRVVTSLGVLPDFVRLLVAPWHLQGEYGPPELGVGLPIGLANVLGFLVVVAALVAIVRWWKPVPVAALGLWWIGVTWVPSSSLVFPAGVMLAERLLFLPSIGLMLVFAGVGAVLKPGSQRIIGALAVAVTLLFTVRSAVRVPVWHDSERFFRTLTADAPAVYRTWYVRGIDAQFRGDSLAAEAYLGRSITLWPQSAMVHEALGQLLRRQGRCAEAVPVMASGLAVEPTRTQLRAKLGECLLQVGDSAGAAAVARDGIALGQDEFTALLERAGQ